MSAVKKPVDKKSLKLLVPLDGLSESHFDEIAQKSVIEDISQGKPIFKKGDQDGMSCYVLAGEVELIDGRKIASVVSAGTEEARHAIAHQQPRQLSAKAKSAVTIMKVSSSLLDMMLTWDQSSNTNPADFSVHVEEDDDGEDWMSRMLQSELFLRLPAMNLQQLLVRMKEVSYTAGDVVVQQDDDGDYYYVIKQGKCAVSRKVSEDSKPVLLAELTEGASFGEESLLSGAKRNATITMITDGVMMRLSKEDFDELLKAPLVDKLVYEKACKVVSDGGTWVDVRLPGEYENSHLPGSISMPLAAIRQEASGLDEEVIYVVYCDTGRRSASAAFLLGQLGYEAVILKGGMGGIPHKDLSDDDTESKPGSDNVIDINRDNESDEKQSLAAVESESSVDVSAYQKEIDQLKNEENSLHKRISKQEEKISTLQGAAEKYELQLKSVSGDNENQQKQQEDIARLKQDLDAASSHAEDFKEQLKAGYDEMQGALESSQKHEEESQKYLDELNHLKNEIESLRSAQQDAIDLSEELTILKGQHEELQASLVSKEEALKDARKEGESVGKDMGSRVNELDALVESLKNEVKEQAGTREQAENSLQELQKQKDTLQSSFDESTGVVGGLNSELEKLKTESAELSKTREEQEKELSGLREIQDKQSQEAGQQLESLNAETEGMRQQLAELNSSKDELEQSLQEQKKESESLRASLDEAEQYKVKADESANEVEQIRASLEESGNSNKELEKELSGLREQQEAQSQESVQQLESQNAETEGMKQQLAELNTSKDELENSLQEQTKESESLRASLDEADKFKSQADELASEVEQLRTSLKQAEESASKVDGLNDDVKQLQEELEKANKFKDEAVELGAKLGVLEKLKSSLEIDLGSLQNDLDTQGQEVDSRVADLKGELTELQKSMQDEIRTKEQTEKAQQEQSTEIEDLKNKLQEIQDKHSSSENEKQSLNEALSGFKEQASQSDSDSIDKISGLEEKVDTLGKDIEKAKNTQQQDAERIAFLEEENKTLKDEGGAEKLETNAKINNLNEELNQLRSAAESSGDQGVLLASANNRIEELEKQLKDESVEGNSQEDKMKKLESELALSRQMADQAIQYKDELEAAKEKLKSQAVDDKNTLGSIGAKLVKENELLKQELKKIFEAQEIAIETGSTIKHKTASPDDIQQILDEEFGGKEEEEPVSQEKAGISTAPIVDNSDLFARANIDARMFQQQAEEKGKKKFIVSMVAVMLVSMLAGGGIFWFIGQPQESSVPTVASVKTEPMPVPTKKIKQVTTTSAAKAKVKKPAATITRKKIVLAKTTKKPVVKKQAPIKVAKKVKPVGISAGKSYRDLLKSGGKGPLMVEISASSFKMGSPSSSVNFDERPRHTVNVKVFSISRYEVSFEDYDRFVKVTGRSKPGDNGWGRGKQPAINVSWDDATAYAEWLSGQTGKKYRLPTEAEWEYAARGGTTTKYTWGRKVVKGVANCFNCGSEWDANMTAPIGSFKPNKLGLNDLSGNVLEWTQDCQNKDYKGAPSDGSAWATGDCDNRMVRGGSYRSTMPNLTVTKRAYFTKGTALDNIGIRLVREP